MVVTTSSCYCCCSSSCSLFSFFFFLSSFFWVSSCCYILSHFWIAVTCSSGNWKKNIPFCHFTMRYHTMDEMRNVHHDSCCSRMRPPRRHLQEFFLSQINFSLQYILGTTVLGRQEEDLVAEECDSDEKIQIPSCTTTSTITIMVSCWKSSLSRWLWRYRHRSIRWVNGTFLLME